jgi:hypothetical protein
MKRTSKKSQNRSEAVSASRQPTEVAALPRDASVSDDELEIRFSLTALGEVAVAAGDRGGRGRRFRGFGPCGAVA